MSTPTTHAPAVDMPALALAFNRMYRLPVAEVPTVLPDPADRLDSLHDILLEEVDEIVPIIGSTISFAELGGGREQALDLLTGLADLLADLTVYAHTEALKWGIPLDRVQAIVMESNASKRLPDGSVLYDERGKVQKGPDYWKPEPRIRALLASLLPEPAPEPA